MYTHESRQVVDLPSV